MAEPRRLPGLRGRKENLMRLKRPTECGLTDRSERPTTHLRFAPLEQEKQREQDEFVKRSMKDRSRK